MTRFDDRLAPKGGNGDDFQKFVWDALQSGYFRSLLGDRYVRPYFAKGNDGAIDHIAIGDADNVVFECKFFAKDRDGNPASDWKKVEDTLGRNLRKNAGKNFQDIPVLYKPWFDKQGPVKGYWFCTSGTLSPGRQQSLKIDIDKFFSGLAGEFPALDHLKDLDVEVLAWNDFQGALRARTSLNFRWFRELPIGLRSLETITRGKTFRRFLDEGVLPFFSREAFNREIGSNNQEEEVEEQTILSALLEGGEQLGLVLSGPGGVGKTRLALQLGREAEKSNWLVLNVERNATRETIEEVARTHSSSAQVLLIIDYAEAANSLYELVQEMDRANKDGEHQFRFVATCRTSALSVVKEAIEDYSCLTVEYSTKADDAYVNWVVGKILATANIPNAGELLAVCSGLPVLAAFAVFLFKQHPDNFDVQFGQIHQGSDFPNWVDKRLRFALPAKGLEDQRTRRLFAEIGARLPMSTEEQSTLRARNTEAAQILDLLQDDRWIDSDGKELSAAHDIFADAIIARYVSESERSVTDRVGDILSDAAEGQGFERALVAVNRSAAQDWFSKIDGLSAIKRVHAGYAPQVVAAHRTLLKVRMPDERTCIRIFDELKDVADAIAGDILSDELTAKLAEAAAASTDDGWRSEAATILRPFLDRAVERAESNIVVRRALHLIPAAYSDKVLSRIKREPTLSETHFLFVAWLGCGLSLEDITPQIVSWLLAGGATNAKASFVFRSFFNAAAALEPEETARQIALVESYVVAWLGQHGGTKDAEFVLASWLNAAAALEPVATARNTALVENNLVAWLGKHGETEDAQFVLTSWLRASAARETGVSVRKITLVENKVVAWLGIHGETKVARFVLKSWLDASAALEPGATARNIDLVENKVVAWLGKHGETKDAGFVLTSWLDAAAALEPGASARTIALVENSAVAWLGKHGEIEDAEFVLRSWLRASAALEPGASARNITLVESKVVAWLGKHGETEDAQFILKSWLDASAALEPGASAQTIALVENSVVAWLEKHGEIKEAGFVLTSWLNASRNFAAVRGPALLWLKQNTNNQDAVFVLKFILKEHNLDDDAVIDVVSWCKAFPGNFDSICRISPILSYYASESLERSIVGTALLVLEHVKAEWLSDQGVRQAVLATVAGLSWRSRSDRGTEGRLDFIHMRFLTKSSVYTQTGDRIPVFALNPSLAHHVAGMIRRNVIDLQRDSVALDQFISWLAAWPTERKPKLRKAIQAIDQAYPGQNLWSRIGISRDEKKR